MSFSVEYIYQIRDRFSRELDQFNSKTRKVQQTVAAATKRVEKFQKSLKDVGERARNIGIGMTAGVTLPVVAFASSAIMAAAKVESLTVNFESLLGSSKAAADMMFKLQQFSAKTPFQLEGIASTARMLLGFGVQADQIIDRLKMLGDVAAGTGRSMSEIGLIFGKVKAKGKLQGEELQQLAERGIPILATLSEIMGKPQAQIQKMITAGKVGFPIVLDAFRKMTSEGGAFYNQMAKQSTTLGGLFSTLKDVIFLAQSEIGKVIVKLFGFKDIMNDIIGSVESMTKKFKDFAEQNPKVAKFTVVLAAIAAAAGPVLAAVGLISMGVAAISAPVAAVVAGGAALIAMFYRWYETGNPLITVLKSIWDSVAGLASSFGSLFGLDFSILDTVAMSIDKIGSMVAVALTPLNVMLRTITGIVDALVKLIQLDFSGYWESVKGSFSDIGSIFGTGFDAVGDLFSSDGGDQSTTTIKEISDGRAKSKATPVDVSGNINVSSSKDLKLDTASILMNRGNNLAYTK